MVAALSGVVAAWTPGYVMAESYSGRKSVVAAKVPSMQWLERFTELVQGPEFPLDQAAFAIAASVSPELDIDGELLRLDALAASIPEATADAVRRALFVSRRFTGNSTNYYDPANSYLNCVLDRGVGIPISLAVLAIECGRRLGVELVGVGMPGHFLVRNPSTTLFFDPFNGGMELSAADCQVRFRRNAPPGAAWTDDYLDAIGSEAIVYRMLTNLLVVHRQRRDIGGLLSTLRLRVALPTATDQERDELERVQAKCN